MVNQIRDTARRHLTTSYWGNYEFNTLQQKKCETKVLYHHHSHYLAFIFYAGMSLMDWLEPGRPESCAKLQSVFAWFLWIDTLSSNKLGVYLVLTLMTLKGWKSNQLRQYLNLKYFKEFWCLFPINRINHCCIIKEESIHIM